jgi:hypothetical protein
MASTSISPCSRKKNFSNTSPHGRMKHKIRFHMWCTLISSHKDMMPKRTTILSALGTCRLQNVFFYAAIQLSKPIDTPFFSGLSYEASCKTQIVPPPHYPDQQLLPGLDAMKFGGIPGALWTYHLRSQHTLADKECTLSFLRLSWLYIAASPLNLMGWILRSRGIAFSHLDRHQG